MRADRWKSAQSHIGYIDDSPYINICMATRTDIINNNQSIAHNKNESFLLERVKYSFHKYGEWRDNL